MSLSTPPLPGTMSLLDKYAAINANIEEARRRVVAARSELESTNQHIDNIRDERAGMLEEIQTANGEISTLEDEFKKAKSNHSIKLEEKRSMEREHRSANVELNDTRRRIDGERLSFLERCREFRSSCKRMRVAASILVLDSGGVFDVSGELDEGDVWRGLQEEDLDSSSDDEDGIGAETGRRMARMKMKKSADTEMKNAAKDEKESRGVFIEAECALHTARSEHDDAIYRCNARKSKLTQQRAQLERHRREVVEMEKELSRINDDIVGANQDAKGFELAWKGENDPTCNNPYKSQFNPPHEQNRTPGHNSNISSREGISSTFGVSNPYKSKPSNPYQNMTSQVLQEKGANAPPPYRYASEVIQNIPVSFNHESGQQQHQSRSRSSRNQRQFGTAIELSFDYSSARVTGNCSAPATNDIVLKPAASSGVDDGSFGSSSSDDDIMSFPIFGGRGNKK